MKLSMSLLSWYLQDQNPLCYIQDDSLCIKGLRFVMDDVDEILPEYLYFGKGSSFFADQQYADKCLLVNHHSLMFFERADENTLMNRILSAFDFFNNWESNLLDASARNAPLQDFVELGSPVFQNPFAFISMDMTLIAASDITGHKVDPLWQDNCTKKPNVNMEMYRPFLNENGGKISDLTEKPQLVQNVYQGGNPVMMLYLYQNNEAAGSLAILQEDQNLTEMNQQLAPIYARYCLRAKEIVSESGPLQSETILFQRLLEKNQIGAKNLQRLESTLPCAPWRLLALKISGREDQLASNALLNHLKRQPNFYFPTELEGICFCLISNKALTCLDLPQESTTAGASVPFVDLQSLPIRRQQAEFALKQAQDIQGIHLCEDHACDYLLGTFRQLNTTAALLHPALETLERYDNENKTELRETLHAYLQQEQNQLNAAQLLQVHPNTLRYRLSRIREIANLTLEDPQELKYLRLSDWLQIP